MAGPFQTTPVFSNLVANSYNITIKTPTGCTRDTTVLLQALETRVTVQTIELCPGNPVVIEGHEYDTPQIVMGDTLQTAAGCDSVNIYEILQVLVLKTYDTLTLCPGQSITIGGTIYTAPGTAVDTLPGAGEDCDTVRTTYILFEPPVPPFLPADTFLCPGDVFQVSSPYRNMRWNGQDGFGQYTIQEPGIYIAAGETDTGCPARDTLRVRACCDGQNLYVPNVFSPNDDGFNDHFRAFPGIEWCQNYLLQIYDRWGELLYQENTPPLGWDGAFRGREMPGGIYVWVIEIYSEKTGKTEILKGDVLLVR
jgi:gliding motility-associated-like protein